MSRIKETPMCCRQCYHLDFEMTSEDYGYPIYYCKLNLFFRLKRKLVNALMKEVTIKGDFIFSKESRAFTNRGVGMKNGARNN